jgi:hypothetical protein
MADGTWFYPATDGFLYSSSALFPGWTEQIMQGYGWVQAPYTAYGGPVTIDLALPPLWVNNNNPVMVPYGQILTGLGFVRTICPWCGGPTTTGNRGNILNVGVQSCSLSISPTSGESHGYIAVWTPLATVTS